ncbi:MAG: LysR family transcriptional regulator [Castellaniella sp.]|uniref:LysR family transcriptional regulator n=1 Tax=Castellaniella sp. TaxID=1955812 RepID=UPI003C749BF2
MDHLQAMRVFTRVVDANSFTQAADSLGMPRATVSTLVRKLEKYLGTRLLNRSTRRLSLTPDGASYYERCIGILADVEDAESSFRDRARGPRGLLRIDAPPFLGRQVLVPRLCEFHHRYPDIELVVGMSDRVVDMVQEAVDCALRIGELQDSTLVAKRIGVFRTLTCAAPSYIERYGKPERIEDLGRHRAVNYFLARTGRTVDWSFLVNGEIVNVPMKSSLSVNDAEACISAGLGGFGMIQPPRYMVAPYLDSGELIEVLEPWAPSPMPISIVYQQSRHLSSKVHVFVDWITEVFQGCALMEKCRGDYPLDQDCRFACEGEMSNGLQEIMARQNLLESVF